MLADKSSSWVRRLFLRETVARAWAKHRLDLAIFALYLCLTVLMTYPVSFQLSTHLAGKPGDAFAHLWSLWWAKKAWLELGSSLSNLSFFYFPVGASLPILSVTPMVQVIELPLAVMFKPVVAYNLSLLLTYILTAFFTYLLCYRLTRNRAAAFLGGVIFGFAPTRTFHAQWHMAQITTYWFPLYALAVVRFFDRPSTKRAIWVGVLLGISALVNFVHTAYFVFPFTLYWVSYFLITRREQIHQVWRQLGTALLLAAILF